VYLQTASARLCHKVAEKEKLKAANALSFSLTPQNQTKAVPFNPFNFAMLQFFHK